MLIGIWIRHLLATKVRSEKVATNSESGSDFMVNTTTIMIKEMLLTFQTNLAVLGDCVVILQVL